MFAGAFITAFTLVVLMAWILRINPTCTNLTNSPSAIVSSLLIGAHAFSQVCGVCVCRIFGVALYSSADWKWHCVWKAWIVAATTCVVRSQAACPTFPGCFNLNATTHSLFATCFHYTYVYLYSRPHGDAARTIAAHHHRVARTPRHTARDAVVMSIAQRRMQRACTKMTVVVQ